MKIEFFGLPGSGKTTMCEYLLQSNKEGLIFSNNNGINIYKKPWKLFFRVFNPIAMFDLLQFIYIVIRINGMSEVQRKIIKNGIYCFFDIRDDAYLKKNKGIFLIYDHYIFQMMLTVLHLHEDVDERQIQKMLNLFLPNMKYFIVVFTDLDIETAAKRISERATSGSRFDKYHDEELIANLYKLNYNIERLKNIIYKNNFKTIKLDMCNSLEENAAVICQYISKINGEQAC